MKALVTRAQLLLMRAIGMRKLRDDLDAKSQAAQADLAVRLDKLSTEIASREALDGGEVAVLLSRLDALNDQLSQQGQSNTERGDTDQNMLREIKSEIEVLRRSIDAADSLAPALGELRAEISSLRADFAREAEFRDRLVVEPEPGLRDETPSP